MVLILLLLLYNKIRNQTTTLRPYRIPFPELLYNKIRNQTTTVDVTDFFPNNYYTTKLEIKPQHVLDCAADVVYYYTTKLEIKPQLNFLCC